MLISFLVVCISLMISGISGQSDLTGTYTVEPYHTPEALYYITQTSATEIFWYGDSNTFAWTNTATGTISVDGQTLVVSWADPAPGTNYGTVTLCIVGDGTLRVVSGDGFDIGAVFSPVKFCGVRGISGAYSVAPYHTPQATYYITQEGTNEIKWVGLSNTPGAWSNVASGTIYGSIVVVTWKDFAPTTSTNHGKTVLNINPDGTLTVVSGDGFDVGAVFSQQNQVISGNYQVVPYHTPSARYYITVEGNKLVWLGDSNTGAWRNSGSGTINGNEVVVSWTDLSPGTNAGAVTLTINSDRTLTVTGGTGFDVGAVFQQVVSTEDLGITGPYQVTPYHTPEALYYVTQTSATQLVWLGDSNTGAWRNTAVGTINENELVVTWVDIPPSTNNGQATFKINPDRTLTVVSGTGFDIGAVFSFYDDVWDPLTSTAECTDCLPSMSKEDTATIANSVSSSSDSTPLWVLPLIVTLSAVLMVVVVTIVVIYVVAKRSQVVPRLKTQLIES